MAQYFFKMSQAEKNDILDKHKTIYDGYVTEYGQQSNTQPLYVQDFANDKLGITVNNKGEVMPYTNMNINEDIDRHDRIGDGPTDLKGGTVDLHGQSDDYKDRSMYDPYYGDDEDDEDEYVSLGMKDDNECKHCDDDSLDVIIDFDEIGEDFEYDIDRDFEEDLAGPMNYEVTGDSFKDEVDDEELPNLMEKLNESLDMFKRFKKYN
jgi:hypothetical protein